LPALLMPMISPLRKVERATKSRAGKIERRGRIFFYKVFYHVSHKELSELSLFKIFREERVASE
jgi:hypothetical protein